MDKLSNLPLNQIVCADALNFLRSLPDESIHCCVTSPPYFGQRKYTDDDPNEIGTEATPAEYVAVMVELFREVRRVLRSDGTCWINLGDSYANDEKWGGTTGGKHANRLHGKTGIGRDRKSTGLPPKSRMMIPARVAIALQDDGWVLRDEIVWNKPSAMPESVRDRTTKAHEMIYMLTKRPRYFYDAAAIREEISQSSTERWGDSGSRINPSPQGVNTRNTTGENTFGFSANGRNKRSVWTVNTEPSSIAHFAMFPTKLIEPMILAGCPQTVCATCGAPHYPVTEKESFGKEGWGKAKKDFTGAVSGSQSMIRDGNGRAGYSTVKVVAYEPSCDCGGDTTGGVVLDLFMGSGTTAYVARRLGRNYIGCDLNAKNVQIARERLRLPFEEHHVQQDDDVSDLPLFNGVL